MSVCADINLVDTERCLGVKTMDAILQRTSFVCDDPAWLKTRRDALIKYLEKVGCQARKMMV